MSYHFYERIPEAISTLFFCADAFPLSRFVFGTGESSVLSNSIMRPFRSLPSNTLRAGDNRSRERREQGEEQENKPK